MCGPDHVINFKKNLFFSSLTAVPMLSRMAVTGTYFFFFFCNLFLYRER